MWNLINCEEITSDRSVWLSLYANIIENHAYANKYASLCQRLNTYSTVISILCIHSNTARLICKQTELQSGITLYYYHITQNQYQVGNTAFREMWKSVKTLARGRFLF